ncbi:DUF6470 family protein [Hydrogenoanaerobacterium sp.]|uniref:DUF6470 family protein n=1 Tax=Hydrogenoanaerobacterium sp. TaxID=2953763 RepID=UPI00289F58A6|nr:DUF6470 family protein [Hydrogenoanaerobacterium sp.]
MQLLKITSVPIKISMRVESPRLEIKQPKPELTIRRVPSKLSMESKNIKAKIDTYEARDSLGFKTSRALSDAAAAEGMQAAAEATAQYAQIGNQMAKIHKGANLPDIVYPKLLDQRTTYLKFLPEVGPNISWEPNQLSMEYTPTELNFDAKILQNSMEYIPGQIQFDVEQYPKVHIEYLGKPMYVPPSASPDYEE